MFQPTYGSRSRIFIACAALLLGLGVAGAALGQAMRSNGDSTEPPVYQPGVFGATAESGARMPDDNPPLAELAPDAPQQTFSYYFISGVTMQPRDSSVSKTYEGLGCAYVTSASGALVSELHLPQGSVIKYLRLYFYDNHNPGYLTGYLTSYRPSTASTDLAAVSSPAAGTPGVGFIVSEMITHTVDNTLDAYALTARPSLATSNLRVCGLRVAYYAPPLHTTFLPVVER